MSGTLGVAAARAAMKLAAAWSVATAAETAPPPAEAPPAKAAPPAPIIVAPRPPREPQPPPGAPAKPMLGGQIKAELRGAFIVNLSYNTGTLFPGSFAYYAYPANVSHAQFFVSPANTVVGFKLSGLSFGSAQITGAMDVNLRSPSPLLTANTLLPQFYDVHMQLEFDRWRIIAGQYLDVLLPMVPDTVNSYPAGYMPGALGYVSPQVRVETRLPVGERFQGIAQASISRPEQTFQLGDELVGRQAGVPDLQGRVALALGHSDRPWERPFEVGFAALKGRRLFTDMTTLANLQVSMWAIAGDLRLWLPRSRTLIKCRLWKGQLLGDFAGGIFQTIDTAKLDAIAAWGGWGEVQQGLSSRWRATVGYGRDDPTDADLSPGARALSQEVFANLLWDVTKTIGFGLEGSRWATAYIGAPTSRVWRGELMFYLRF